ncbi:MAG: three-Cys-motif partner protein TcmP [Nanoarchaeota archaeon]|nr:three-Cys-motif partner protein TcmP [Nanoarchaeota archaeon]
MDWLKEKIARLEATTSEFKDSINEMLKIRPDVYNEFQNWTPLKLILLNYTLHFCTQIIKKSFFKRLYYVDLFAGSGINKMKATKDFLIGSPLIASLNHADNYTEMLFCENDVQRSEALDLRLKSLKKNNLVVMKRDCAECLGEIIKKVERPKTYSLFFIDPHSTEFSWSSMKKVLNVRSDIIFTFMSSEIWRAVGLVKKGGSKGTYLDDLYGDQSWQKAKNCDDLVCIYAENVAKVRSGAIVRTIKIQSKRYNFCYHMIFITNETKGGNPWIRALETAKERIESNSDVAVKQALDILKKRQSELGDFQ